MNTASSVIELILKARDEYSRQLKEFSAATKTAANDTNTLTLAGNSSAASFARLAAGARAAGLVVTGIVGALVAGAAAYAKFNDHAAASERQQLRLEALVRATGGAAGFTGRQLDQMARSLAEATLANTDEVRDAIGILLTFKSVYGDTFTRAIGLSQDLAETFGGDLRGKINQLGKALENPVQGISALAESGITFDETQKAMIRKLVESNHLLEAQGMILEAVAGQVKGAAKDAAQGLAGSQDSLGQQLEDLQENLSNTKLIATAVNWITAQVKDANEGLSPTIEGLTQRAAALEEQIRQAAARGPYWAIAVKNLRDELHEVEALRSALLRRTQAEKDLAQAQGERAQLIRQIGEQESRLAKLRGQYAEAAKKAEREKYEALRDYAQKGLDSLRASLDEAHKREQEYLEQVRSLSQQQVDARQTTADKVRELHRRDLDDAARQADLMQEAETKLAKATVALFEGADPAKTREAAQAVQELAGQLQDTGKAVYLTEKAGSLIERTFQQQKEAATKNAEAQVAAQDSFRAAIDGAKEELAGYEAKLKALTEAPKTVQLRTEMAEAEQALKKFRSDLDALPESKIVTLKTVVEQASAAVTAQGYATGGRIPGYGGGDRYPILVEGGEHVVKKDRAVLARPLLELINDGPLGLVRRVLQDLRADRIAPRSVTGLANLSVGLRLAGTARGYQLGGEVVRPVRSINVGHVPAPQRFSAGGEVPVQGSYELVLTGPALGGQQVRTRTSREVVQELTAALSQVKRSRS